MTDKNCKTEYLFPFRMDADDPYKVTLVQVDKKVYQTEMPGIWKTRKELQKLKKCTCPRAKLWACDCDCNLCEFQSAGDDLSLDTDITSPESEDSDELTLQDTIANDGPSTEDIAIALALLDDLEREMERLNPQEQYELDVLAHSSERKAEKESGISRRTLKRHVDKTTKKLHEKIMGPDD